ncbi:hypothetical protein [Methylobacterium sp. Leaf118]|uniref:hypothetical protein n=1 Tax=Methylobacterium sp. Leaf118 TaxID=2876562 RepID=UPI001E520AA2|nr:hypothetical protein [Methylobacterium sp. Leaf118]
MKRPARSIALGAVLSLSLMAQLQAAEEPKAGPMAEAEAKPAQACLDHLKALDTRMEKDGYWLGGSGYGYGYPLGGY